MITIAPKFWQRYITSNYPRIDVTLHHYIDIILVNVIPLFEVYTLTM